MSLRAVVSGLVFALALGGAGCKKQEPSAKPLEAAKAPPEGKPAAAPAPAADGVRKVPIEVHGEGYSPDRIPGKPGEKLTLVFTRKADGKCIEELKTPDGKQIALPKNEPVEVSITVPQQGEVKFACGMDMISGVVVAEKS